MNRTLLLFDIDGTLMLSGGAGMRAMKRVATALFGEHFSWEGIDAGGHLDPLIFHEAATNNGIADPAPHHERFRSHYVQILAEELHQNRQHIRIMPGVHELFALLRQRILDRDDLVLGLLTGNYGQAVPIKLRAIGVDPDWFLITAFGDEAPTRPDLVDLALRRYERKYGAAADPARVVVIGDTPRDIHCAKVHGCVAFAVATGRFSVPELQQAGADVSVANLADPMPLLELLDQFSRRWAGSGVGGPG